MKKPYYVDVYKSGRISPIEYEPGGVRDRITKRGGLGPRQFVAYRIKVTPKAIVTTTRAIPGPTLSELQKRRYAWVDPPGVLPPVSHQMLKALGAFGMLFLIMAFALWFLRDLFQ